MNTITKYCTISPQAVILNGKIIYQPEEPLAMHDYLSEIYSQLGIDYRKFYKMDALSKLGFLSAELLLDGISHEFPKQDMALILFNSSSSLDADKTYQRTIDDRDNFFPSPSEFVYTLPNIVTGEIAIRNKIYGETMFYVFKEFHAETICGIINDTMSQAGTKHALTGWVDVYDNKFCSRMMLCETASEHVSGLMPLTAGNIKKIFI